MIAKCKDTHFSFAFVKILEKSDLKYNLTFLFEEGMFQRELWNLCAVDFKLN